MDLHHPQPHPADAAGQVRRTAARNPQQRGPPTDASSIAGWIDTAVVAKIGTRQIPPTLAMMVAIARAFDAELIDHMRRSNPT